jgi:hypothetical protein
MMWAALLTNQARPAPPLAAAEISPNCGELGRHASASTTPSQRRPSIDAHSALSCFLNAPASVHDIM